MIEDDSTPDMDDEDDAAEPMAKADAKPYLDAIQDAEKCMEDWEKACDRIAKRFASLERLAKTTTDREFQIFWANLEVLRPIVYARPPVPVVTPRFKDRKELPRRAADVIERALVSDFERDDVDATMRAVRDDLTIYSRGVLWVRLGTRDDAPAAIAEHLDRRDWLCSPARKWQEVDWVARRSWLTRDQWEQRFGEVPDGAEFEHRQMGESSEDNRSARRGTLKAPVWELWSRSEGKIVWVAPGVETVLDERPPLVDVDGFFPCPMPAFGTREPETLIPVPDFLYYRDQVDEIDELTIRIGALSDALKMRGFYPAGQDDIGKAVERAFKSQSPHAELIPVSSHAALGGVGLKDSIVWLPIQEIANTILALVQLRRQMIEDVYEISGLSDIMRGETDPNETARAQSLKSQYGSMRVRHKQDEIQRIARDMTRLKAEIMAENIDPQTLLSLSQVDDLPSQMQLMQQAQPLAIRARQGDQQAAAQLQTMQNTVTIEAVVGLLRDQRMRPFVLEIETDSTIQPDEDADRERGNQFLTAIGGFMREALPVIQQAPETGPFIAETLRFVANKFRPGRVMDQAIDELADAIRERKPAQDGQADAKAKMAEMQLEQQRMSAEMQAKAAEVQIEREKVALERDKMRAEIEKIMAEIERIKAQTVQAMQSRPVVMRSDGRAG